MDRDPLEPREKEVEQSALRQPAPETGPTWSPHQRTLELRRAAVSLHERVSCVRSRSSFIAGSARHSKCLTSNATSLENCTPCPRVGAHYPDGTQLGFNEKVVVGSDAASAALEAAAPGLTLCTSPGRMVS